MLASPAVVLKGMQNIQLWTKIYSQNQWIVCTVNRDTVLCRKSLYQTTISFGRNTFHKSSWVRTRNCVTTSLKEIIVVKWVSWRVRFWQAHRHLWAECQENVGASTSHSRMGLHGLLFWEFIPSYQLSMRVSYKSFKSLRIKTLDTEIHPTCVTTFAVPIQATPIITKLTD
jgi:hypothetical protein